jgi:hypothetical protein
MGGIEAVDPRYAALFARAQEALGGDPRVLAVELSGSVASGTADEWSDLDLQIIADPDGHATLVEEWPVWLAAITPTVFARTPIAPFVINAVTDEGLTLDVAVWCGAAPPLPSTQGMPYTVGMLGSIRFDSVGDALEYAVAEQLRGMAGPFVSLIQRDEHARHLTGVAHLLGLLTTVFLAETGEPPLGKHWNRTLTAEQREAIAALPPVRATRDDLIAFGLALAELVVSRARPLYPRFGLTWPSDLAAVTADRVKSELGIDISDWLH